LQPLRAIFRQLYGSGRLFFAKLSFGRSKESGIDFILCKWFEQIAFQVKTFWTDMFL